jgi:CRISPR system Cascade subunit CasC
MFVELHIIQNFPPSNLNRDDIGQPKTTDFGGVRRARISSQCQKRAIRLHPEFQKATQVEPSKRTQLMVKGLIDKLALAGVLEAQARPVAVCVGEAYAKKKTEVNKKTGTDQTPTLIFVSDAEFEWLSGRVRQVWADAEKAAAVIPEAERTIKEAAANKDTKAENAARKTLKEASVFFDQMVEDLVKQTKERTSAPDIALYGRMLADRPETNIDAACQVAHAISTHGIGKLDMDYYTAMDDIKQAMKDPGAGFLDVAYFTSACFYRYMRVDCAQLQKTLGDADLTRRTVEGFMRAAEAAIPTGKINSHAQHMRPSFMLAVVRTDGSDGWNLANAFETPVKASSEQGIVEQSVKRLQGRFEHLREFYGDDTIKAISVALPDGSVMKQDLGAYFGQRTANMQQWVEMVSNALVCKQEG